MSESNDIRGLLEAERRAVPPPADGYERLMRRHRRSQTGQRVGAAFVAMALAGAAIWGAGIAFHGQRAPRPAGPGPTIDRSTASDLRLAWSYASAGQEPVAPPTVGRGVVLVFGHAHLLSAYPESCGVRVCSAIWKTQLPLLSGSAPTAPSEPSAPVIRGREAYVLKERLYAFDLRCTARDGSVCTPAWVSAPLGVDPSQPDLAVDGSLILVASDRGVEAFDIARCRRLRSTCRPSWTDRVPAGASGVAVGDGVVVATSPTGVYAFVDPCPKDPCSATWTDPGGPSAGNPTIAGGMVYVVSGSELRAYATDCAGGRTCSPSWRTSVGSSRTVSDPVVAGGRVWVTGDRLLGYVAGRACPGAPCSPVFTGPKVARGSPYTWAPPVVVGGVVFTAWDRPTAFDASCEGPCRPIWQGPVPDGPPAQFLAPTADERTVYFLQSRPDAVLVAYRP
jgi:hypothetical protein